MTKERIEELERLAKEATPGKWFFESTGVFVKSYWKDGNERTKMIADLRRQEIKDTFFISEANPQTILEMIAYIRELEKSMKELADINMGLVNKTLHEVLGIKK